MSHILISEIKYRACIPKLTIPYVVRISLLKLCDVSGYQADKYSNGGKIQNTSNLINRKNNLHSETGVLPVRVPLHVHYMNLLKTTIKVA